MAVVDAASMVLRVLMDQPNFWASSMASPSSAAWCISFLGMQPTLTHVPPRPHVVP